MHATDFSTRSARSQAATELLQYWIVSFMVVQVTHDISHLTSAAFLTGVGSKVSVGTLAMICNLLHDTYT